MPTGRPSSRKPIGSHAGCTALIASTMSSRSYALPLVPKITSCHVIVTGSPSTGEPAEAVDHVFEIVLSPLRAAKATWACNAAVWDFRWPAIAPLSWTAAIA